MCGQECELGVDKVLKVEGEIFIGVRVTGKTSDGVEITIEVTDSGIGIPAK